MFELYQYQKEDVDYLTDQQFALLGHEMGTGKTHEAIELMHRWRTQVFQETSKALPILVICPIDVQQSWVEKLQMQYPDYVVEVMGRTPKERASFLDDVRDMTADVFIMHWAAVQIMEPLFTKHEIVWSVVVADEVHKISNQKAKTSIALKKYKTYSKLGLSGTASGDKPWNLWSVLNWLDKKSFSSFWRFVDKFVEEEYDYISRGGRTDKYRVFRKAKNLEYLHKMISPYYIRHLKDEQCCTRHPHGVMPFLPPKVYKHHFVELSAKQRKVYDEMENQMVAWVQQQTEDGSIDLPIIAPIVVAQQTRLSQIAMATPRLETVVKKDKDGEEYQQLQVELEMPSSKFDVLKEIITDYAEQYFVVFTSSKRMANLTRSELELAGISCCVLSGDTPSGERQRLVNDFVAGKYRIFIGVIAAVAEGIDGLQHRTSTAIFIDRNRSAIKNKQAEDRLHRGGQKGSVTIIDIIAKDTIDEYWVLDRLPEKWRSIREMLDVQR